MRAQASVDLSALKHNFLQVQKHAPGCRIMAVIKSNAYGHGALAIAHALTEADALAVACLDEALVLREAGIHKEIVLLEGVLSEQECLQAAESGLQLVIHQQQQVEWLERLALPRPLAVWLKVDTGMRRLGVTAEQFPSIVQRLQDCRNVRAIQIMSHLACADDTENPFTTRQCELFERLCAAYDQPRSMANSAGILAWPQSHYEWVRPGIMLYGASPLLDRSASSLALKPVMTLRSHLIAIQHCHTGDRVGYGGTWECPEDMPVGVVAIGYGDGYPRHAPTGTPVLVDDQRVSLIGRVSMDMLTVDLRQYPHASVGDTVTLWGHGLPADEVAQHAGTIAYELFCQVTPRVKFHYD